MPLEGLDVERLIGLEGRDEGCVDALGHAAAKLGCETVTLISISERQLASTRRLTSR